MKKFQPVNQQKEYAKYNIGLAKLSYFTLHPDHFSDKIIVYVVVGSQLTPYAHNNWYFDEISQ